MPSVYDKLTVSDWYDLGIEYLISGNYNLAIKCFMRALRIDSNFLEAWKNLAIAYNKCGQSKEVIKCLEKASKLESRIKEEDPKNFDNLTASEWYDLGNDYNNSENYDLAIKCFRRALALDPCFLEASKKLAIAYDKCGDMKKAIEYLEVATKLDPQIEEESPIISYKSPTQYWYNLGIEYNNSKNYVLAIKCFKRARKINPKFLEAWKNLAIAYDNYGQKEKAIVSLKKAAKLNLK